MTLDASNGWMQAYVMLPVSQLSTSAPYVYTIKEVGETSGLITIGSNEYDVTYAGDQTTGYSVTNKQTPTVPPTPTNPSPKTSDSMNVALYAGLFATALAGFGFVIYKKRKEA